MIISFQHKGLKKFYETGELSKIHPHHEKRLRLLLGVLDAAKELRDLDVPGAYLHPLKGSLKHHWSMKVNGNWRLSFKFEQGDVHILNYVDYH